MTLSSRERRLLAILPVAVGLMLVYRFMTPAPPSTAGKTATPIAGTAQSVKAAELYLDKLKRRAATVPKREEVLKQARTELDAREANLVLGDTAAQAQAQLLQILKAVGRKQQPPLDIRGQEIGQTKPFGPYYGEVFVTVGFDCQIHQLVNFLADLANEQKEIATDEIHLGAGREKDKVMPVRLTVAGLVPRRLVPEKKGAAAF